MTDIIDLDEAKRLQGIEVKRRDNPTDDNKAFEQLAKLSQVEYDRQREEAAKRLGIRVGTLEEEVKKRRPKDETDGDNLSVVLPSPESWPDPVDGGKLLDDLMATFRRYIVLPKGAEEVLALWTVHTHIYEAFRHTPRLNINAPEKNCGKSLVLDVLEHLTPRGLKTENLSTATLFRVIDSHKPTLLVDEVDSFLKGQDELRGTLNAGHCAGARNLRCVGDTNEVRAFKTFAPVALAGIGGVKGPLLDRSISISMERRRPTDPPVARFMGEGVGGPLRELSSQAARWGKDNFQALKKADPAVPDFLFNRVADNWRPLLGIADLVGGEWPERARSVALQFVNRDGGDDSIGPMLLADIEAVFKERVTDHIPSADLCEALGKMEDRPWPEWRNGHPITPTQLARRLKPFGIGTTQKKIDGTNRRGYFLSDFQDALSRYPLSQSATSLPSKVNNGFNDFGSATEAVAVAAQKPRKPAETIQGSEVAGENGEPGEQEADTPLTEAQEERIAILHHDGGLSLERAIEQAIAERPGP